MVRVEELCAARQVKSLRILDVGCGNGNLAIPLSYLGHEVTGVDYDDPSVNQARNVAKDFSLPAEFITGSLEQVQGRQFDVVLASEVLEHQTNPKKLLEDCRRLCAPQGILLLSVPNGRSWEEQLRFLTTQTSSGQRIKQLVKRRLKHEKIQSLAAHPHEFFFSYRSLDRVLFGTGWKIKNSAATAAWFKEFYYLLGRLWMKRSSAWFHACDASDAWLAKHLCLGLGDGWLVEAQMFDASRPSVVEVVDTLNAGGAERVVHELCSRLPEQGFDVQAYALLRGGELEKDFRSASIPSAV